MNNYFCVKPFFGYEYNTIGGTHCCLLAENYDIEQVRSDILNKKRSSACSACWKLEDHGMISDRKIKNSTLDYYWNRDIRNIEEDARQGKYNEIFVKFMVSNTCNSTCVTCNSYASTAWGKLEEKMGIIPIQPNSKTKEDVVKQLNFKELVVLHLLGGEPLYEKINFYILEKLIEHNNSNCFISITTNGSTDISDENKKILEKFKNLDINLSIDGVGTVFEYMRYPLKWSTLQKNLKFFRSISRSISVSYTISNLNLLYHQDTIDWFKQEQLPYNINPVKYPNYFRPEALPKKIKDYISDKIKSRQEFEYFLGRDHTEQDDSDFAKMLEIIKLQDSAKNILLADYLPELDQQIKNL